MPKKKDSPQERANLALGLQLGKVAFERAARKYGGEVRYVSQHSMIWGGLGSYFSRQSWLGLCSQLSIEWIKSHMMGGDLVKHVIRIRDALVTDMGLDDQDAFFARRLGAKIITVESALGNYCKPRLNKLNKHMYYRHYYPFGAVDAAFQRCCYQLIVSETHTMASCVYEDGKMDFYDPAIGDATGLSSTMFLGYYLREPTNLIESMNTVMLEYTCLPPDWIGVANYVPRTGRLLAVPKGRRMLKKGGGFSHF